MSYFLTTKKLTTNKLLNTVFIHYFLNCSFSFGEFDSIQSEPYCFVSESYAKH